MSEDLNPDYFIGDFINKKCPNCDAQMLGNKAGDEWCSNVTCDYGCEGWLDEIFKRTNNNLA